jgi:hypothetical protein
MATAVSYNLSEIQKNADMVDAEDLHLFLLEQVRSGKYDTFFEALSEYVQEYDLDLDNQVQIRRYITPTLKGILYKEAQERSLLKDECVRLSVEDFF